MGCNVGFAKTYQNQIFGIKINDHINKYIDCLKAKEDITDLEHQNYIELLKI